MVIIVGSFLRNIVTAGADRLAAEHQADGIRKFRLYRDEAPQPDQFQKLRSKPEFMNEMAYQIIREKAVTHLAASVNYRERDVEAGSEGSGADDA